MTQQGNEIIPPIFTGIARALSEHYLQVPQFQRSYAWADQNVKELYEDIAAAMRDKEQVYFLGSVVTIQTPRGRHEVVDGQQRLATVTILLAAMRDYYEEKSDERSTIIKDRYLLPMSMETLQREQRLLLNPSDNEYFLKRILSDPKSTARTITPSRASHRKINDAALIAEERVKQIISETEDPIAHLNEWITFLVSNARVIWFTVSSEANAFMIFETLNDRGLALTVSDLLKNYLFSRSDQRMREAEDYWLRVVHIFEANDNQEMIVRYIHNYWSSRFGLTRERELFSEIKKRITSSSEVIEFTHDLALSARFYSALLSPDHEYWDKFSDKLGKYKVKESIQTLITLRLEQYRPLLLAVLRKFNDEEIARTVSMLVSWTVRFVIFGAGGGTLEKKYPEAAEKVSRGDITSASVLYQEMQSVIPTDIQFQAGFATVAISRAYVARYLLMALENYLRGKDDPELVPNSDTMIVNLEHILPDTFSEKWKELFSEDDHRVYRYRLGNLTLLGSKKNSTQKDATFEEKRTVFEGSDFHLNREIAKRSQWTRAEIEQRQAELAKLAIKIWSAKPSQK